MIEKFKPFSCYRAPVFPMGAWVGGPWLGLLELFIKTHFSNLGYRSIPRDRPGIMGKPLEAAAHRHRDSWFPEHVKDTKAEYLAERFG